jgi:DNA-binding CsgD family transcriptional regulator
MWNVQAKTVVTHHPEPVTGLLSQGLDPALALRVLDEIDYGVMVLDDHGRVRHANHLARHELAGQRLIVSHGGVLLGANSELSDQLQMALEHALRGQRRLLQLKDGERELSLAFVPLGLSMQSEPSTVLVLVSRQNACDNLSVRMYARSQNLSPSEEAVMIALCRGLSIPEIAESHGVAQSTVRSQIKALREKTGSSSIRHLLQRLNSLPPMVPALRIVSPVSHNAMA